MSKEFINYIDGFKDKSIITRENLKKHKFKLREGIMTFDVDLKHLNCILCKNVNTCSLKNVYTFTKYLK